MKSVLPSSTRLLLLFALLMLTPALAHAQKKKSSAGLVTAEDIAKHPSDPLERIIVRKVTGIQLVKDDNGSNILQIRGAITIPDQETGEQHVKPPLYVVDGLPVRTPDGTLPSIDPLDLDSLRVLKGTDAAVYGIEAGAGVIVFYTKRGKLR